jgi:hypothetical protein
VKPNIRIARGQPTTVDIHVIHLPRGVKTPLSLHQVTMRVIREEVFADASEAQEISEALPPN